MHARTYYLVTLSLLFALSCDEHLTVINTPPSAEVLSACRQNQRLFIDVKVDDAQEEPVALAMVVNDVSNIEGATLNTTGPGIIAPGGGGVGLLGLNSAPGENVHTIEWARCGDQDTCTLATRILELGRSAGCLCLTDLQMLQVLPRLELRAQDTTGELFVQTETDPIPVAETCLE